MAVVMAVASHTPLAAQTPTPSPSPTAIPTPAACPQGVMLQIAPPASAAPTSPTSSVVTVTVSPPDLNIKAATAGDPTSFHLHYFIDTPASAPGATVPAGDPKIIHSASLTPDLGSLTPGPHSVTVVLGQSNHVACDARATVSFNVATNSPAAPKTGNLGASSEQTPRSAVVLVALVMGAVLIGARQVTRRS
jgi:hypothetical protein